MAEKDAATVLEEAADLLLVNGRCRFVGSDGGGRFCLLGAIAEVSGLADPEYSYKDRWLLAIGTPAHDALVPAVSPRLADHHEPLIVKRAGTRDAVWSWNDLTDDDDEVRDTLLLVAKDLRAEATP